MGQGERTFAEVVERFAAGETADDVPGCIAATSGTRMRPLVARPAVDINDLPEHDYSLIDVERHFALKGDRQLDYITSQGCRFRCTFCADPTVYGRGWSGLEPPQVGDDLERWHKRYGFTDVGFQDETFFTQAARVAAIADEIRVRG